MSPEKIKTHDTKFSFGVRSTKALPASKFGAGPGSYEIKSFISQTFGVGSFGKEGKSKFIFKLRIF